MKQVNPNDLPPLPTIDVLILNRMLDNPSQTAKSLADILGEHHSGVTTWLEKFVRLGILARCGFVGMDGAIYLATNKAAIREYLKNHKKK